MLGFIARRRSPLLLMLLAGCLTFATVPCVQAANPESASPAAAPMIQDASEGTASTSIAGSFDEDVRTIEYIFWIILLAGSIAALVFAAKFYKGMKEADEGNEKMIEIAGYVRTGAAAYLRQQYKVVAIFIVVVSALLFLAYNFGLQEQWVFLAFVTAGFFSGMAGFIGMRTATAASSRTAAGAQKSLNDGLQVAFRSGAVMGLTVVGLGTLDMSLWYLILRFIMGLDLQIVIVTMLCGIMGASSQALFARVGGGIFTKAADVGADLVGKVEQGIPEDDPRNPATIADNVGDNVGDVAGMGADLYESYCGSILATASLGLAAFMSPSVLSAMGSDPESMNTLARGGLFLPMIIAAIGIGAAIFCIFMVRSGEDASQKALLKVLGRGIDLSMVIVFVAAIVATIVVLGTNYWGVAGSIGVGLAAGWLIGKWTEYATSDEYKPTQQLASQAETGPATVIIGGVADGMKSVWAPVIIVSVGMLMAFGFATGFRFNSLELFTLGLYGVGIAAVGMLSTLGITLATDAYGPIADNAGGNAEMSGLDPQVRERTDALDSLGNTTAATGKGFAIGSAALTALALLAAYVEQVKTGYDRWGASVDADSGYTKIADNFLINKTGSDEDEQVTGYFVMPEASRKMGESWTNVEDGSIVPAAMITESGGAMRIGEFGDELVAVKSASLPQIAQLYNATVLNPRVLIGIFIGCMTTFVFCALTMKAVGRAAYGMVEEVRRQFREKPGIMDHSEKPDYARPVEISTTAAQREMIFPSLMGITVPIIVGLLLGVGGVLGLLVGTLTCGFCVAIFMANAGGSWDNAKKYIEAGALGGKYLKNDAGKYVDSDGNVVESAEEAKNPAHGAAVIGDTVGDPFKDTSGPSLNILIKLMSIVSVVAAGLIVRYSLVAMGIL